MPHPAAQSTVRDADLWDYSALARSYDARPDYAGRLIDQVLKELGISERTYVIDIGAGTGAFTVHLCRFSSKVIACEPNAEMRTRGRMRSGCESARWISARAQALPIEDASVDLICFGSSFNVIPAALALAESTRVLRRNGHWLALWNHRDLDDPLQRDVERCIRHHVPHFNAGRRRQDPGDDLASSGAFLPAMRAQERVIHRIDSTQWLRAWHSHATLKQQAGDAFPHVLKDIGELLIGMPTLDVPYVTRVYWAQRAARASAEIASGFQLASA